MTKVNFSAMDLSAVSQSMNFIVDTTIKVFAFENNYINQNL